MQDAMVAKQGAAGDFTVQGAIDAELGAVRDFTMQVINTLVDWKPWQIL